MINEALELLMHRNATLTEDALRGYYADDSDIQILLDAERYSLFAGGKRIRPLLCLEAARACCGDVTPALNAACALEALHTYTLIHDDLPSMDNDDLRRGRPTNHKVFGEGVAILAGDALLTEAFAMLARVPANERYDVRDYVAEMAYRTGSLTLVGGQVLDLEGEGRELSVDELRAIHNGKTAALIIASVRLGAMAAGATQEQLDALTAYGRDLGLAFQIRDDMLDVIGDAKELGKATGVDDVKNTFVQLYGLQECDELIRSHTKLAKDSLSAFENMEFMLDLSDSLVGRTK